MDWTFATIIFTGLNPNVYTLNDMLHIKLESSNYFGMEKFLAQSLDSENIENMYWYRAAWVSIH